jgi:hypothetical protein
MSERKTPEQIARDNRERAAIQQAKEQGRCVRYIDNDGCEVTTTPSGHAFYNVSDWW